MGKRIFLLLFLLGFCPALLHAHEFYISITTIHHQEATEKLSIRVKIFVNDLEESIFQEQGIRLGLWKNVPIENAQAYVADYVCSRLSISINGTPIPLQFQQQRVESAEVVEDHVIVCQLATDKVPDINQIKVYNTLLTETFDAQTNIVNIRANDSRKTINLDKRLPEDEIIYD